MYPPLTSKTEEKLQISERNDSTPFCDTKLKLYNSEMNLFHSLFKFTESPMMDLTVTFFIVDTLAFENKVNVSFSKTLETSFSFSIPQKNLLLIKKCSFKKSD